MDKYEYKVRVEEMKTLIAEGDYEAAAAIADTIDWRRVKSVMMLCTVSDVYKINRRYEESKEILLLAYERHPGGRLIVYSLCELCLKLGEFVQAIEYYKEFVQVAPKDSGRYILQYKIYEAQDVSLEERIAVLEELKRRDYREKWAYELAYLYHRVGLGSKCVEECNELFASWGEGRYVTKALELKQLHAPLTDEQAVSLEKAKQSVAYSELDNYREEFSNSADEEEDSEASSADYNEAEEESSMEFDTREYNFEERQEIPQESEEMDIRIKPVDVSQYNTINLQQELAESMKEILFENPDVEAPEPEAQILPERNPTDEIRMINETEVYFGDTADIGVQEEIVPQPVQETITELPQNDKTSLSNTGIIKTFIKPSGYDEILTQEYDGQIGLVMPEEEKIEKQITGQLRIEDILAEWERQKREIEQKRMEEVRTKVRKQTDTLFANFDEETKTGLLEKLEKAMVAAVIKEEESKRGAPNIIKVADIGAEDKPGEKELHEDLQNAEPEDEEIQRMLSMEDELPEAEENAAEEETAMDEEISIEEEISAEEIFAEEEEPADTKELAEEEAPEAPEALAEEETSTAAEASGEGSNSPHRELSDSENEAFGRFVHHKRTKRQLIEVLDNISLAAYTGNVIITGEEGTGAIQVAKGLIKEVQQSDSNFSGKVAKVSADTLNKKDVTATLSKLENGAIIIERASRMKGETVKKLLKVLEQENTGYIVILEDIKPAMNELIESYEELGKAFNLRIDLEALDDQSLVAFARKYAEELEYSIDEFGVLALHTRIADMQTSDHEVTVAEVQEMVEEAIYFADKKNPKHFFDILVGKRYDEDDMIILREKDFMHY